MGSVLDETGARLAGRASSSASTLAWASAGRRGKLETGGVAPTYEGDFVLEGHLPLECGRTLLQPVLHYAVYGRLNAARDNAVLVCHALSGSALAGSWWPGLFGKAGTREQGPGTRDQGIGNREQGPGNGGARGSCSVRDDEAGRGEEKQILRSAQDDNFKGAQDENFKDAQDDNSQISALNSRGVAQDDNSDDSALNSKEFARDDKRPAAGIVDLETECVICVNLLGSCYGSTGPGSVNPEKDSPEKGSAGGLGAVYGPEFPLISIRDNVRAQAELLSSLGIERLKLAIGGSIGGMQALEWAILFPERVARAVVIGVAPLNAMGLALNHLQRRAITGDPDWLGGWYLPQRQPRHGLALARQIATLSYKSPVLFAERFGRNPNRNGEDPWGLDRDGGGLNPAGGRFDVAGFLDYQGERFPERFDANAYLAIMRTMDTWDPARGWRSAAEAYGRIQARVIFVGISSDGLFPADEVRRLADEVRAAGADAEYREMTTAHGHDAFLAEQDGLLRVLA
jgi:homoserine O-acetyltransferase